MNFTRAIVAIVVVLTANFVAVLFGFYGAFHWLDIPMHFFGGVAIGLLGIAIWSEGIAEVKFKGWLAKHLKWWLVPLFVIGFTAIIGIGWEVYEYLMDNSVSQILLNRQPTFLRQGDIPDTMLDLTLDLVGAAVALIFYKKK